MIDLITLIAQWGKDGLSSSYDADPSYDQGFENGINHCIDNLQSEIDHVWTQEDPTENGWYFVTSKRLGHIPHIKYWDSEYDNHVDGVWYSKVYIPPFDK